MPKMTLMILFLIHRPRFASKQCMQLMRQCSNRDDYLFPEEQLKVDGERHTYAAQG